MLQRARWIALCLVTACVLPPSLGARAQETAPLPEPKTEDTPPAAFHPVGPMQPVELRKSEGRQKLRSLRMNLDLRGSVPQLESPTEQWAETISRRGGQAKTKAGSCDRCATGHDEEPNAHFARPTVFL